MTTTTTDLAPLSAARVAAARLSMQEKAQLMSELAQEIAQVIVATGTESAVVGEQPTHRALWAQLQNSMRDLGGRRTLATQLEQDRAERDQSLGNS